MQKNNTNLKKAIQEFKKGNFVIVMDHKERENEADLVLAAKKATPSKINFMIKNAGGLICVPMQAKRLEELKLPLMTENNTEYTKCAFTISVDAKKGAKTGISAFDRAKAIQKLSNTKSKPDDFLRPGHTFPLKADNGGLTARQGHTEASIELCNLSGLYPAAVICEIIGKNGKMMKGKELENYAKKHNLTIISINDLIKYIN